jgi:predicted small secreted protein
MRKIFSIAVLVVLSLSLSGCFIAVAGVAGVAVGSGGGYIYKHSQDDKEANSGKQ